MRSSRASIAPSPRS
jgi:hypothetical protein